MKSNKEITNLLDHAPESEIGLEEDLIIYQPDGTRACLNWELRGKGYSLLDLNKKEKELSDKELLESAYKNLENYSKK
jgi:hypothetical protein